MTVRVLFFGATADAAGTRKLELDIPGDACSREVFDRLVDKYPALARHRLLYSINRQYASGGEAVRDGDEFAVFTAVSGG